MTIYKVYSRSIVVGVLSAIVYTFIGIVIFGLAIEHHPDYPQTDEETGWFLLGFILFCYLVYILARATARRTVRVGIVGKKMIVRYARGMMLFSTPDFELPFYQISSYKDIRKWYGSRLALKLANGTRLTFREKYLPFLRNRPYDEFIELFIRNYETGSNALPAIREHFDAYSISESAISGFAPVASAAEHIPQVYVPEAILPEQSVSNIMPKPATAPVKSSYIKARRSLHFHFIIWLAVIACIGEGTFLITAFNSTRYAELVLCAIITIISLYTIVVYWLNTPGVETENIGITVKGKTHYWRDIKKAELTGKQPYRFILPTAKDGIMLQFADGSTLYLHDLLYANLAEVRANIEHKTATGVAIR